MLERIWLGSGPVGCIQAKGLLRDGAHPDRPRCAPQLLAQDGRPDELCPRVHARPCRLGIEDGACAHEGTLAALEALLEVADSIMTYRARYRTTFQLAPVLDLLIMDESLANVDEMTRGRILLAIKALRRSLSPNFISATATVSLIPSKSQSKNIGPRMASAPSRSSPKSTPMLRVVTRLDGERIVSLDPDIGYQHTGIEKTMESKLYYKAIPCTDRMDYLAPMSNNLGYILAVEKLLGIEAPERAHELEGPARFDAEAPATAEMALDQRGQPTARGDKRLLGVGGATETYSALQPTP